MNRSSSKQALTQLEAGRSVEGPLWTGDSRSQRVCPESEQAPPSRTSKRGAAWRRAVRTGDSRSLTGRPESKQAPPSYSRQIR